MYIAYLPQPHKYSIYMPYSVAKVIQNLYIIHIVLLKYFIMFKKFVNIIWTYSPQDYWVGLWSKTSIDEKAVKTLKEIKKRYKLTAAELADVGKAIKQVGNQLGDIDDALKGKARKGRKKNG